MDRDSGDSQDAAGYCAALVRAEDRDRFLAAQFAPVAARAGLLALLAVNADIARASRAAREPILLRMRIEWWREALAAGLDGRSPPRQPALAALIGAHAQMPFEGEAFAPLLDARARDLAADPLTGIDDAIAHAAASAGSLARLALQALGIADPTAIAAARLAGIAFDLVEIGSRVPFSLTSAACDHIAAARALKPGVPDAARAVMLWAVAADARLRSGNPARSPPLLPLMLAWRAWRGGY